MTLFGIPDAALLVSRVVGRPLADADARTYFARATWTGLAEPGDRIANIAVRSLGAPRALEAVIEKWDAARLCDEIQGEVTLKEASEALERWRPRFRPDVAVRALTQASRFAARLMIPGDPLWPIGVNDLGDHSPLALWVRGVDAALGAIPQSIALVGARAATGYGEHITMEASAGLVDRGYAIVSGAAYGIDGMAHRAALASHGRTIAFLAGGVDRFYPSGHDALLTRIVETGAVISELPCGSTPTKWRFLQRNRLIAAAAQATVVLEAGWRSGSLNTANHASQIGRPLGAVPGPVTSAASAGCHRLIRSLDAVCVTNADEMAELAPLGEQLEFVTAAGRQSAEVTRLLDAMSDRSPRSAEDIARRAGLSVQAAQSLLGALELDGRARSGERGWMRNRTP